MFYYTAQSDNSNYYSTLSGKTRITQRIYFFVGHICLNVGKCCILFRHVVRSSNRVNVQLVRRCKCRGCYSVLLLLACRICRRYIEKYVYHNLELP